MKQLTSDEVRTHRRQNRSTRCGWLTLAIPWPKNGINVGSLVRTADAVGSCLAIPRGRPFDKMLRHGNTIGDDKVCIHRMDEPLEWLRAQHRRGRLMIAVELCEDSVSLKDVSPIACPTVVVLGHETQGIDKEAWPLFHKCVEIPMNGVGSCLNVAVAGSLVLYKLAGMS